MDIKALEAKIKHLEEVRAGISVGGRRIAVSLETQEECTRLIEEAKKELKNAKAQ